MLNNAKINGSPIHIWKISGGHKVVGELRFRLIRKFNNEMELIPEYENDEILKKIIAGQKRKIKDECLVKTDVGMEMPKGINVKNDKRLPVRKL